MTPSNPAPKNLLRTLKTTPRRIWRAANTGALGMQGAALAVLILSAGLYLLFIAQGAAGPLWLVLVILLIFGVLGGLLAFLGQGIAQLITLLARIPWPMRWMLAGGLAMLVIATSSYPFLGMLLLILPVILTGLLMGAGAWPLMRRGRALTPAQRRGAIASLSIGLLILAGGLAWYAWPGPPAPSLARADSSAAVPALTLPDPARPGPYAVQTITYGSGVDRYRPEYGKQAPITTRAVDGSLLLTTSWTGFHARLRELEWGVSSRALPLNGRVWYPGAADSSAGGPFPLVLIVHGNHTDMDFSDAGYAYLGDLLASRGYIVVSVDENFLNGGHSDFPGSMNNENDARAWLLLEHLRVWHAWNQDPASPFYGLVDTNNIALIGHSRGGEAAAVAAAFNRLPFYPDNAALTFDYDYNIRGVVAIAPIDSFYRPAGQSLPLSGVSYLVLHGSHDGDASSFGAAGLRMYDRLRLEDASVFKAAVYIYRANHGQFNTTWADWDIGPWRGLLDRAALLPAEQQRQVAEVYISAFLESVLRGQAGYRALFQDARAGGAWLPDTVYITSYAEAGDRVLADFREDVDLTTLRLPGGAIAAQGFTTWREQRLPVKWGVSDTSAVLLAWDKNDPAPVYTITLPADLPIPSAGAALLLSLTDARQPSAPPEGIDLSVVLRDAAGNEAVLPLSRYRRVQPQLQARLWKLKVLERNAASEAIPQSVVLPLADFTAANPSLDLAQLAAIRLVFDRTPRAALFLSLVGLRGW